MLKLLTRLSPPLFLMHSISKNDFRLTKLLLLCIMINQIIKHVLGIPRPKGAKNCGIFDAQSSAVAATTYGMPSGHSQIAWCYAMYHVRKRDPHRVFYVLFAYMVSMSRVLNGCHDYPQVILGALLGASLPYVDMV